MKPLFAVIAVITLVAGPAWAQNEIGSQASARIDFSDSVVTEAELDVAEQSFASPGIAPDSPFHVFKRMGEFFREALAVSREDKARLHLGFAKERLAEARYLMRKNKTDEALRYINEYNEELNRTQGIGANISAIARETEDTLQKSTLVLELVREKVPEKAKHSIDRAINNSLEKSARISAERKILAVTGIPEIIHPQELPVSGQLAAATISAPETREEMIESSARKELEQERGRQETRRKSIKAITERAEAAKGPERIAKRLP
ncbi:MAG: hypothetical protein HYW26_04880 [Candidatus Aenigmarchaeota archaeon]|nr:hypothetical protein [Candidatus Aenigmarchaeota archaeon]